MSDVLSEVPDPPLATVEVYYNGYKLTPAPLIDWTVESQFDDGGVRTADLNRIVLTGTVLITPTGSYEQMFEKQTELRNLFATDNGDFAVLAGPGNATLGEGVVICSGLQPRVTSVNVPADTQFTRIDYTVELEDAVAASGVSGVISSLSDQWSFREDAETCTVQVTHQVNAAGIDSEADKFDQAFRAVRDRLGIHKLPIQIPYFVQPNASGLFGITHPSNPAGGPIYEVSVRREEVADVPNGTYQATEIFVLVSGVPYYFTQRTEAYSEDANGIATVTLAGSVQGLGRTITIDEARGGDGFSRASTGFVDTIKPQLPWDASGVYQKFKDGAVSSGLAIFAPTSFSLTENRCQGVIDFSVTYTDDPTSHLPSGIATSSCGVSIVNGIRLYASHVIPLRRIGNIVQDVGTTTEGTVSIQCQAQAKNTGSSSVDTNRVIQYVQDEINRLKGIYANSVNYLDLRISNFTEQFSERDRTSQASLEYTFVTDLASVPSVDSDIALRTL